MKGDPDGAFTAARAEGAAHHVPVAQRQLVYRQSACGGTEILLTPILRIADAVPTISAWQALRVAGMGYVSQAEKSRISPHRIKGVGLSD